MWTWLVFDSDHWDDVTAHWPIALAMRSYVAGSTPMGGGTVGFPILVLLFGLPATLGRDFSFAVQSIGMTSTSIFIPALVLLCRAGLKIAIPTSVIIMAFNSMLDVLIKNLTTGMQPGVYEN